MNGSAQILSPRYEEIKNQVSSQHLVQKNAKLFEEIIGKKEDWYIAPSKHIDVLTPEQREKIKSYDELNTSFGGNIPKDLKETWENLNKRPNITQEEFNKLKEGGTKPADYDQIKGDLGKWTTTFPNLDPKIVREKYDALPSVELSEADKEAIREYASAKNERDALKNKVSELEKRPTPEALNQAVQTEKDKYKDYDDNKKKLTDWQEAFPNLDPKQAKEQQGSKETKPADYDSTKEQLKKWTDAFPNSDAEFTGKDPSAIKVNYDKYKNQQGEQKPSEPTNEDKELGIDSDNEESVSKRKLISEIRRLTSLFSDKELSYRKVEVHFTNDRNKLSSTNDGNIYLLLDQKDKNGKWSDKLVLWSFVQELTHEYIIIKKKEEYAKEFNLRFSPLFWKHFLYEDKSTIKWVDENINADYKDITLLDKPSTFPINLNFTEALAIYFRFLGLDNLYQELVNKEIEKDVLEEETITVSNKWIDKVWLVIGGELIRLTSQELSKGLKKEELIKLWTKLEIVYYNKDNEEWILKISYHRDSAFSKEIRSLIKVPLELEIEYLKKEQAELPTTENFHKKDWENQELKSYLHDHVDEKKYSDIINKIKKNFQEIK